MGSWWHALLVEAVERWRVPRWIAAAAFAAPFAGVVVVGTSRLHAGTFRFLTAEDSVLEWLQFVGFAAAAVFAARVAARLGRASEPWAAAAYAFFALSCVFIAGEEISWGQRLLDLETPESLAEVNEQGETTLHNIEGVLVYFNLGMGAVGLAGATVPWLARRQAWLRDTTWRHLVPPLFLSSAFFVIFAYKLARFTVVTESRYAVVKLGEWPELCLAAALGAFAWLRWRWPSPAGRDGRPGTPR